MAAPTEDCDYLVVGAGASGMAFVDTLLAHSPAPVSVVLIDERKQPGGHWNDAYDYATLHQPARNYGVLSGWRSPPSPTRSYVRPRPRSSTTTRRCLPAGRPRGTVCSSSVALPSTSR